VSEAVGELMHKPLKAAGRHTTRCGAAGRHGRSAPAEEALHVNRDQRVRASDLYCLHQIMRRNTAHTLMTKMKTIDWIKSLPQGQPGIAFFRHPNPNPNPQGRLRHPASQFNDRILPWDVIRRSGVPLPRVAAPQLTGKRPPSAETQNGAAGKATDLKRRSIGPRKLGHTACVAD
jgi:hypothetical protein